MKQVWVKVIPWATEAAQAALESGADALWVEPSVSSEVKKLARVPTVAADGDLLLGKDVVEKEIREKRDEEEIRSLALTKKVVVKGGDWTIIPMENLLSRTGNLFLEVKSAEEGHTSFSPSRGKARTSVSPPPGCGASKRWEWAIGFAWIPARR
jgi:3-dehydroquinate synthase II